MILEWAKTTSIPLKIGNKTGMSAFTSLIQYSTGSPNHSNRQEEEIRGIQFGKKEVKLSLLASDMILYIENPKDSSKKLLELINEFSKVAWYKINIQKLVACLYANNELREIKKTILFTIIAKRTKYLEINLIKDVKDLYLENYKTLKKEQGLPLLLLCSSYQSQCGFFFLVINLLFSQSSVGQSGWFFPNLVEFPVWFWEKGNTRSCWKPPFLSCV